MLFQGVKLLVTNWRLTLVQVLPAMWIWAAMLDLKAHVLYRGHEFHPIYGPLLIPIVLTIAAITAASFFLNAVFAFAISRPGQPQIRPAFAQALSHRKTVLAWGFGIGIALGVSTTVTNRWGVRWFGLCLRIVVAVMMVSTWPCRPAYIGHLQYSRRDQLTASAVGGAIGAVVCSPPYVLGRGGPGHVGIHTLRVVAVLLLVIAVVVQTGATSAVKAIKLSARLVVAHGGGEEGEEEGAGEAGSPSPSGRRRRVCPGPGSGVPCKGLAWRADRWLPGGPWASGPTATQSFRSLNGTVTPRGVGLGPGARDQTTKRPGPERISKLADGG